MSASPLTVSWPGGRVTADPGETTSIGRDPENTITLDSPAVSRRHGRLRVERGIWVYTDLGSTGGSFVDGARVTDVPLHAATAVTLGRGDNAVVLRLAPGTESGNQPTRISAGRPAGQPAATEGAQPGAARTVVRQPEPLQPLRVESGGESRAVRPGQRLTVGRDDDNIMILDHESVSRHHLVIEESAGQWVLRDLGSSAGTWRGEVRVGRETLAGAQTFRVGDPRTGPELRTQSASPAGSGGAGIAEPRGSRIGRPALVAAVAAVLVLVLVGAAVAYRLTRGLGDDDLARGTVKLTVDMGSIVATGSGTVIDKKRGLILTNAHVAAPQAPGFAVNQAMLSDELEPPIKGITIAVSDGRDDTAEERFRGTVVAADGYLDLAVVKITQRLSGALVGPDDLKQLTQVPMADSDKAESGDDVRVIGYPEAAKSEAPTFTEGVVSGLTTDVRLRTNRAYLNTDARINHGNSGGLAADSKGEIVGVPTLGRPDQYGETALYAFRPINFARPLIAAARAGKSYTSPWTTPAPSTAKVTGARFVAPGDKLQEVSAGCTGGDQVAGAISVGIEYTGFPAGPHTDLLAVLYSTQTGSNQLVRSGIAGTIRDYPTPLPASGCATLTLGSLKDGVALGPGTYRLEVGLGGSLTPIYTAILTYPPAASTSP